MNILLVVMGLPDEKRPARSVFNIRYAKELSLNHKVTILYLRSIKPGRSFFRISQKEGIDVFEASVLIPKMKFIKYTVPLYSLFMYLLNKRILYRKLSEIEVIHAIHRGAIELSYLISDKFKKPMISQFIGGDLNLDIGYFKKKKYFMQGIHQSHFLCFNSKKLASDFLSTIDETKKIKVLYRGVKLDEFPFYFQISSEIKILFLGGFPGNTNTKGGLTLIEAIELINPVPLPRKITFSIAGPNSLNFKNKLSNLTNKNIVIEFIGAIDKDIVGKKLRESHIVIIPSLSDGMPNVLFEAMSSGNMIIATKVGGIPEILEDRRNGILIPPNNPSSLMSAIINSVDDIELIHRCAKEGRKMVENFSYQNFVRDYLDIYSQII